MQIPEVEGSSLKLEISATPSTVPSTSKPIASSHAQVTSPISTPVPHSSAQITGVSAASLDEPSAISFGGSASSSAAPSAGVSSADVNPAGLTVTQMAILACLKFPLPRSPSQQLVMPTSTLQTIARVMDLTRLRTSCSRVPN
ncbi:hypothetical protein N7488_006128 [Penicillium malachiteum]|nr:hypothetical protein N7488_006128 [Penicillium malachiteum]